MVVPQKMSGTPVQLGVGAGTLNTAPVNTKSRVTKLVFSNNTGSARTVTVYIVPSGGAASATNAIWTTKTIAPNAQAECFEAEGQVLNTGDFLQALADAATAVSASGSVLEIT